MVDYGVVFEEAVDRWRWWEGYGGVGREASEIEAWRAMVHIMDCFARGGRAAIMGLPLTGDSVSPDWRVRLAYCDRADRVRRAR